MHVTDYVVLGFLVASMLLAAAKVLPRRHSSEGGGKRRPINAGPHE